MEKLMLMDPAVELGSLPWWIAIPTMAALLVIYRRQVIRDRREARLAVIEMENQK